MTARPIFPEKRRRHLCGSIAFVLMAVVVMLAAACVSLESNNPVHVLPEGKYVFIEHNFSYNITKISGSCWHTQQDSLSTYSFDEKNGVLTLWDPLERYKKESVNNSLTFFYGREGIVGWLGYTVPMELYTYPVQFSNNVTIESISYNGTVALRARDVPIVLKPKERWENITRAIESREALPLDPPELGKLPDCIEEIVTTENIYNAGIFDKNMILVDGK